jgi:hypothetical protein
MPTLTRKPKPDPTKVYIPIYPFVGPDYVVKAADRLRGSNPIVQNNPHLFAEDGTSTAELGAMRVALEGEYHEPKDATAPRTPGPIPLERRVIATRNVWAGKAIAAWKGQIFDSAHPFVKKAPDAFVPAPKEA